jgi:hypothetical protein
MLASRSHRIELILCIAVLGGCMKIYPDPELPDIEVEWYDGDCSEDGGNVLLVLNGVDDATVHEEVTAACSSIKTTLVDVPRQRYKLQGSLLDAQGVEYNRSETEIDLRNGIDEHAYLYFGGFSNFRVEWTFDMGASCESVNAAYVQVEFAMDGQTFFGSSGPCYATPMFGNGPDGTYSVSLVAATDEGTTVAISPELPDVTLSFDTVTDLGTLLLTPCGAECP